MTELAVKFDKRTARKTSRRNEKKRAIADSALLALQKLGYANTSLRDIVSVSDLSLGMLHYYFEDKTDLILYCVDDYKRDFVGNLREITNKAEDPLELRDLISARLAQYVFENSPVHTLWYDIRNQAMFDPAFKPLVSRIELDLEELVELIITKLGLDDGQGAAIHYAALDGLYRYFLQRFIDKKDIDEEEVRTAFQRMLTPS